MHETVTLYGRELLQVARALRVMTLAKGLILMWRSWRKVRKAKLQGQCPPPPGANRI
jgi:hypothetical protein